MRFKSSSTISRKPHPQNRIEMKLKKKFTPNTGLKKRKKEPPPPHCPVDDTTIPSIIQFIKLSKSNPMNFLDININISFAAQDIYSVDIT